MGDGVSKRMKISLTTPRIMTAVSTSFENEKVGIKKYVKQVKLDCLGTFGTTEILRVRQTISV